MTMVFYLGIHTIYDLFQSSQHGPMPMRNSKAQTLQLHSHLLKSNLVNSSDNILQTFSNPIIFSSFTSPLLHSYPYLCLSLFRAFISLSPLDHFLFSSLARLSSLIPSLLHGKQTHAHFFKSPFLNDDVVKSSLLHMYSKCGSLSYARNVFDQILQKNSISYTAMLNCYSSLGLKSEALSLFSKMDSNHRTVMAWTTLISGFIKSGNAEDALRLFIRMRREEVVMEDAFIMSSAVSGAADMAALELGRQLHSLVVKLGYDRSEIVENSIVDMYAKCSDVSSARACFESMCTRDVFSWTTMIVGEAQHGKADEALRLFDTMVCSTNVKPNEVTFVGLLYACSHSGLVKKGKELFNLMVEEYRVTPSLQHYTCLLDLYSRSGLLEEAERVIEAMPFEPDEPTWAALLSACKKHGSNDMSLRFANHLFSLKPQEPSTYILLSNAYATMGKWDYVAKVRKMMVDMDVKKESGYSWIEIGKGSYVFRAGDVPHDMSNEILGLLIEMGVEMKKRGYIPDTSFVMHDLDEQEKVQQLSLHSERIAISFGLLKSVPGSIIRVVKNLRVCGDCHVVLKFISEIAGREFVVRDATRFHHFKQGKCSCGDFW